VHRESEVVRDRDRESERARLCLAIAGAASSPVASIASAGLRRRAPLSPPNPKPNSPLTGEIPRATEHTPSLTSPSCCSCCKGLSHTQRHVAAPALAALRGALGPLRDAAPGVRDCCCCCGGGCCHCRRCARRHRRRRARGKRARLREARGGLRGVAAAAAVGVAIALVVVVVLLVVVGLSREGLSDARFGGASSLSLPLSTVAFFECAFVLLQTFVR
jgi:hypothetical protein